MKKVTSVELASVGRFTLCVTYSWSEAGNLLLKLFLLLPTKYKELEGINR